MTRRRNRQPVMFSRTPASPRAAGHSAPRVHGVRPRGIILPLALLIIGLLAVLAARVVFRSNADLSAVRAAEASLQARMAAEAGIQRALSVLQGCPTCQTTDGPTGIDAWYNNPDAFQAVVVRGPGTGTTSGSTGLVSQTPSAVPTEVGLQNAAVWRYSVVGTDPLAQANVPSIRYGLSDEAAKLNVNAASRAQLATLIRQVIRDTSVDVDDLAKAIYYYNHAKPVAGRQDQTEESYYKSLDPPAEPAYGPFTSLEQLLMVRGVTGRILYGEDWNRNGYLDPQEDDGDASFPPDNGDGTLDRGLYPFLTIWSSDPNLNSRNQQRVNINNKNAQSLASLAFLTAEQKVDIATRTQKKSILSLLDLLRHDEERPAVFASEDLPLILDELTTRRSQQAIPGLVNVNTAPAEVLQAIGFTEQEAGDIVTVRAGLSSEVRSSVAWLLDQGIVEGDRLGEMLNSITARSYQYHIESVGFADHLGTFSRLEAIVKMQAPLPVPQMVYWRDLSSLGIGWPIRGQEDSTLAVNRNG